MHGSRRMWGSPDMQGAWPLGASGKRILVKPAAAEGLKSLQHNTFSAWCWVKVIATVLIRPQQFLVYQNINLQLLHLNPADMSLPVSLRSKQNPCKQMVCFTTWETRLFAALVKASPLICMDSFSISFTKSQWECLDLANWNSVWLVNALPGNLQTMFENLNALVPIAMRKTTGTCYGLWKPPKLYVET